MDRRARRWRLPLAMRIGAVPALVAVAGALAFGLFSQSDAAPAGSWATTVKLSSPRPPASGMPVLSSRNADMSATVSVNSSQSCVPPHCDDIRGTVRVWIQMDGRPDDRPKFSAPVNGAGGIGGSAVTIKIPSSELSTPGYGSIHFDFSGSGFGYSHDIERLKVRDKYSGQFLLSQSSDTSFPGEKVDFTATYAGGDAVSDAPTGTLELTSGDGGPAPKPVPGGKINVTGKTVTFSTTKLPAGTRYVGWTYSGDGKFDSHQYQSIAHTVKQGVETKTELTMEPNPTVAGAPAKAKVKVTAKSGGAVPTGNVTVKFAGYTPATGPLRADGTATFERGFAPAGGEHAATASYEPTGNFAPSESAEVKITVSKADTTTTVTADPREVELSKAVNFLAKVEPPAGNQLKPTGKVTYFADDTEVGICELTDSSCGNGWAVRKPGKYTVTYKYSGDGNFNASSGGTTVRWFLGSTTTLTGSAGTVNAGSPVTLTAQVAGSDPKVETPFTGKVTFLNATKELGKADVGKDGKATFTASGLAVGAHNLTAKFEGSDALQPSTSEKFVVQVNAAGTPGQGGGSQNGGTSGGSGGGSNPQPKNLASTGADIGLPLGIGAVLVIVGAAAITVGARRRRVRTSRR